MNEIILQGILFIVLMLASIVVHEMGHLFLINKYTGRKQFLEFNKKNKDFECDIEGLKPQEIFYVTLLGVISGFTIITVFVNYLNGYMYLALIILYFSGCRHDLRTLYDLNKEYKYFNLEDEK